MTAFAAGALVFFLSQVVLRLPWQIPLGRWVQDHREWLIPFVLGSALTAGLFEETGRWIGYKYLLPERSRRTAVMLGLGHGGLEAFLLVGLPLAGLLFGWYLASRGKIPPGLSLEVIRRQVNGLSFWTIQLAVLERASAMAFHVGAALIVLQVWLRGSLKWLGLAIALHFVVNGLGALLIYSMRAEALLAELVVAALGIAVLWLGQRLTSAAGGVRRTL